MISLNEILNNEYLALKGAEGKDSKVYLNKSNSTVIKVYEYLRRQNLVKPDVPDLPVHVCFEIVNRYCKDTLKVKRIIDEEWNKIDYTKRGFCLNGHLFEVKIDVVPQGNINIIDSEVVNVGQKYFSGRSLNEIYCHPKLPENVKDIFSELYNIPNFRAGKMRDMIEFAFRFVEKQNGLYFDVDNINIKPFIETKVSEDDLDILKLVITDLSTSLLKDYEYVINDENI